MALGKYFPVGLFKRVDHSETSVLVVGCLITSPWAFFHTPYLAIWTGGVGIWTSGSGKGYIGTQPTHRFGSQTNWKEVLPQESTWTKPAALKAREKDLKSGWTEHRDPASGKMLP